MWFSFCLRLVELPENEIYPYKAWSSQSTKHGHKFRSLVIYIFKQDRSAPYNGRLFYYDKYNIRRGHTEIDRRSRGIGGECAQSDVLSSQSHSVSPSTSRMASEINFRRIAVLVDDDKERLPSIKMSLSRVLCKIIQSPDQPPKKISSGLSFLNAIT
jgi:hypothetical protein